MTSSRGQVKKSPEDFSHKSKFSEQSKKVLNEASNETTSDVQVHKDKASHDGWSAKPMQKQHSQEHNQKGEPSQLLSRIKQRSRDSFAEKCLKTATVKLGSRRQLVKEMGVKSRQSASID